MTGPRPLQKLVHYARQYGASEDRLTSMALEKGHTPDQVEAALRPENAYGR